MTPAALSAHVARVRAYLHSPEGRAASHRRMLAEGWPYERVVGEAVCYVTRIVTYERIQEIADQVIIAELAVVAA